MKSERKCSEIRDDLFHYHKQELSPAEEICVREHISDCEPCRIESDEMSKVLGVLSEHCPVIETPDISKGWNRIQSRVRLSRQAFLNKVRSWIIISVSAITMFGGACLIWLLIINDKVVAALHGMASSFGWDISWLTSGPVSSFLAPLLFICLCSIMTLLLSPFLLRKVKEVGTESRQLQQTESIEM